jgi:hypothetical protein
VPQRKQKDIVADGQSLGLCRGSIFGSRAIDSSRVLAAACLGLLVAGVVGAAAPPVPISGAPAPNDKRNPFVGVYQIVPLGQAVPGAPKAKGTLDDLPLTAKAVEQAKTANLRWDPVKNCRVAGPFRVMAMPDNRIEVLPSPRGGFFMLFKNNSVGNRREIEFGDVHTVPAPETFEGESLAHWKGNELVVDTTGFSDKTWLNGQGAPHDAKLHMVETYRLLPGAQYLELTVTADDPGYLATPYTYTRYYQRQTTDLGDYFCEEDGRQN